jgi:hypothetical protein
MCNYCGYFCQLELTEAHRSFVRRRHVRREVADIEHRPQQLGLGKDCAFATTNRNSDAGVCRYLIAAQTFANVVFNCVPILSTAARIAIEMVPAMRAYSMAVVATASGWAMEAQCLFNVRSPISPGNADANYFFASDHGPKYLANASPSTNFAKFRFVISSQL